MEKGGDRILSPAPAQIRRRPQSGCLVPILRPFPEGSKARTEVGFPQRDRVLSLIGCIDLVRHIFSLFSLTGYIGR